MGIEVTGKVTANFDLLISKLGSPEMQRAAAQGLNEHVRQQRTRAVNRISAFTRQPMGLVGGATRARFAAPGAVMSASVITEYPAIAAGEHTGRSWTRAAVGATHKDWKGQTLKGTFTIKKWGGAIYSRMGPKWPVKKIWGPILANELAKETRPNLPKMRAFMEQDALRRILEQVGKSLM